MKQSLILWTLFTFLTFFPFAGKSQTNAGAIAGTWIDESKGAQIEIYEQAGKYFGKIIWAKEPLNPATGKPKTDQFNPNSELRNNPLIGLVILTDFVYQEGKSTWSQGHIYDPETGKTYKCKITLKSPDQLRLRGYIGVSLLGLDYLLGSFQSLVRLGLQKRISRGAIPWRTL